MSIDDAMFLELLRVPVLGMKRLRLEHCRRCKRDTSHEFVCLSVTPRVWGYTCLDCRPERRELEAT